MRRVDIVVGCAYVLLGLLTLTQSLALGLYGARGPDAGFFPSLLAMLLVVLGTFLAVHRLRSDDSEFESFHPPPLSALARVLTIWTALMISILLLPIIGFVAAMLLLTATALIAVERLFTVPALVTVVATPVAFWILFDVLLQVPLPEGPLGI